MSIALQASEPETISYGTANRQSLLMTVYRPVTKSKKPTPAVLLIHGGGWVSGSRSDVADEAKVLASQGLFVAAMDYRLAPRDLWPAQLNDVRTAVRFLRSRHSEFGIDPHLLAAVGTSAGGQLSLFLGAQDSVLKGISAKVQAVGSISGIHDMALKLTPEGESYQIVQKVLGAQYPKALKSSSPLTFVDKNCAPVYFIQGAADPWVPAEQTLVTAAKLKSLNVKHEVKIVPGMGHGLKLTLPNDLKALQSL